MGGCTFRKGLIARAYLVEHCSVRLSQGQAMTRSQDTQAPSVGTLRRRALQAARKLLEESGSEALHLRTIAA